MLIFRFLIVLFAGASVMAALQTIEAVVPRVVLWWIAKLERREAEENSK